MSPRPRQRRIGAQAVRAADRPPRVTEREPGRGALALDEPRGLRMRLGAYAIRHLQVFFATLGHLYRHPLSSLMTAAVIGIALALPAGLYMALDNLQRVSGAWDKPAQISLFLKQQVDDTQASALARELAGREGIASVETVTREAGLKEFRELSGFGAALDALDENPLPAVLLVTPAAGHSSPDAVAALVAALKLQPEVEIAQFDLQWLQRLHGLMDLGRRTIWLIAGMLGLGVLLIVGNTIRLDIENRREEIAITELFGATHAFIRRPFLYSGVWYGLLGGVIAWAVVGIGLKLLQGPVGRIAGLYGSDFQLATLGGTQTLGLLLLGALLGLLGSWVAVSRHLGCSEPS